MTGTASPPTQGRRGELAQLTEESSTLVCCGSGGVGKTTIAAVLAMEAARGGRRAVVVTIDPARRLADALGLDELSNTPRRIEGDWDGELWALMLDTKSTFDGLVRKHAADEEQAQGILDNRFYRNISGALSGTQEYMAMEKLYELHTETDYDLVVVDTPPTRSALDFLEAPNHLARFLDHRLYRVLMTPTRGVVKAVNVAAQAFLRTLSRTVGGEVVKDAIAFFQAFEGMEEGFIERARGVEALLAADETGFVLVASPRADTVGEAAYFANKLDEGGITVKGLIVNRMHPTFGDGRPEPTRERALTFAGADLGGLYANLAEFQEIASRDEETVRELIEAVPQAAIGRVPFLRSDVHDMAGMAEIARHLF